MSGLRHYYDSIDTALLNLDSMRSNPARRQRAADAVRSVIAIDGSRAPLFYLTPKANYVGVLGDDGSRLARIQGLQVRSRHRVPGARVRQPSPGQSLPDANLPYILDL